MPTGGDLLTIVAGGGVLIALAIVGGFILDGVQEAFAKAKPAAKTVREGEGHVSSRPASNQKGLARCPSKRASNQ